MKIKTDFSQNFLPKIRSKNTIKYVIIHYTGMQSEIESIKRLKNIKSKVSCHYLINRKGQITQMVNDNQVAWHAGKSKWKNFKNLNENSIGIELVNKGHEFGYQNFSSIQITNLINLCKDLKKKYLIKKENFLGHSDIAPLRKLDPGEKFPWKRLSKYKLGNWYEGRGKKLKFTDYKKIESLFFNNLFKIGYRYFIVTKRTKNDRLVIKSFQQHYLPHKVSGKIDQKTLNISDFLAN
jgi:N-acetylmuramoyl-L-alanine amidase